jgi:lysylphosphatidylglycerol synthetase-like protein (DUF2156 family)
LAQETKRPWGVTAVGALTILGGIFLVGIGIGAGTVPQFLSEFLDLTEDEMADQFMVAIMASIVMAILVPLGLALLIVAFGALHGKKWAWTAVLIMCGISVALALADVLVGDSTSLVSLIINSLIIGYMFTGQAKNYFGRAPPALAKEPETAYTSLT